MWYRRGRILRERKEARGRVARADLSSFTKLSVVSCVDLCRAGFASVEYNRWTRSRTLRCPMMGRVERNADEGRNKKKTKKQQAQEEIGRNRRRRNGKGKSGWQPRTPTPPRRGPVLGFYVLTSFHSVYESPLRFTTDHRGPFSQRDSTDRTRPKRREKGGSRETTRRSSR